MIPNQTIKALAFTALGLACLQPARADFKSDAREVFSANAPSVFGVRGLLDISITMNGQAMGNQEKPLWSNAAVIGDGLLVAAYKSLRPDVGAAAGNRPGLEIEAELSEIKLIDEGGEEYDAKLVLHDEDLGVAFLALDPHGDNAGDFSGKALDLSKDVEVKHLDQLIGIGRMPENMRFQAQVKTGEVTAIVKRPRKLMQVSRMGPSTPVFDQAGSVVGFVVVPKTREGSPPTPVLLPNKYIRGLVEQAVEKQAALAEEKAEEKTEDASDEKGEETSEDATGETSEEGKE